MSLGGMLNISINLSAFEINGGDKKKYLFVATDITEKSSHITVVHFSSQHSMSVSWHSV